MIRGLIFDFDGLIVDTETPWYNAYKEVYRTHYGVDLPLEVWAQCIGTSFDVFNPLDYLEKKAAKPVHRARVQAEARERYSVLMKDEKVRPGVEAYLREAANTGRRIGLASSSARDWVETHLSRHGLLPYFHSIHTSDDVANVKPDPELYIRALDALRLRGNEAIAFEDSLNGSKAAKAAGAYCVAVPNQVTSFMEFAHCDMRLASMEDLPLNEVILRIESAS